MLKIFHYYVIIFFLGVLRMKPTEELRSQYYAKNRTEILAQASKSRHFYAQCREWAIEKLGGKCIGCGADNPVILEFDHIDPKTKTALIADLLGKRGSVFLLVEELKKCQLLCANCHTIKTKTGITPLATKPEAPIAST